MSCIRLTCLHPAPHPLHTRRLSGLPTVCDNCLKSVAVPGQCAELSFLVYQVNAGPFDIYRTVEGGTCGPTRDGNTRDYSPKVHRSIGEGPSTGVGPMAALCSSTIYPYSAIQSPQHLTHALSQTRSGKPCALASCSPLTAHPFATLPLATPPAQRPYRPPRHASPRPPRCPPPPPRPRPHPPPRPAQT